MEKTIPFGITGDPLSDGVLALDQQLGLERSQKRAVNAVNDYLDHIGPANVENVPPLVVKPTGYGKSRIIAGVINERRGADERTLMIVGAKNLLLEQNKRTLEARAEKIASGKHVSLLPDFSGEIVLGTWQGLHSFVRKFEAGKAPGFKLGVIDEAHNQGTDPRINALKRLRIPEIFGLTATAVRSSGPYRTPESYGFTILEDIVSTLPECIMESWLAPFFGISIDTKVILPEDVLSSDRQFSPNRLYKALREHPGLFRRIGKDIGSRFLRQGLKTIAVVNRVVEEAVPLAEGIREEGFRVGVAVNAAASGLVTANGFVADEVLERYELPREHSDALDVIVTIQCIGEGIDLPCTECIAWASPTRSHVRYAQIIGRGARRHPGKAYCVIADYVYMVENFGYSLSFAQFFSKKELENVGDGVYYLGPSGSRPQFPNSYLQGAELIDVLKVPYSRHEREDYSLATIASKFAYGGEAVLARLFAQFEIRPVRQVMQERSSAFTSYFSKETLEFVKGISETWMPAGKVLTELDQQDGRDILECIASSFQRQSYKEGQLWIISKEILEEAMKYKDWRSKQSLCVQARVSLSELEMAYGNLFRSAEAEEVKTFLCVGKRIEVYSPDFLLKVKI